MTTPIRAAGRAEEICTLAQRAAQHRGACRAGAAPERGCWCGGAGGRYVAYLPDPLDVERDSPELLRVFQEYCSCATGQELQRLEDALRDAVFSAQEWLRQERLWGAAGVPPHYQGFTLESFPESAGTAPAVACVREWLSTTDRWLYLWGAYGTGKTGLAVAAMRERLRSASDSGGADARALFITVPDMLSRLRHSYNRSGGAGVVGVASERDLLDDLNEAPLLVLDDLGAERATDWAVERLFGVLNRRHDWHRPTVLTSNLSPKQLAQHAGERIAWRVLELCRRGDEPGADFAVEVRGPNLRDRGGSRDEGGVWDGRKPGLSGVTPLPDTRPPPEATGSARTARAERARVALAPEPSELEGVARCPRSAP